MRHVFISYAREDHECAEKVAHVLEDRGWPVWWDRTLLAGEVFHEEIQRALDRAGCVIVLWSRHSIQSDWVIDEADDGKRRELLVPALIDEVRIPLGFRRIHTETLIGWTGDPRDAAVERLAEAVEATLDRSSEASVPTGRRDARAEPNAALDPAHDLDDAPNPGAVAVDEDPVAQANGDGPVTDPAVEDEVVEDEADEDRAAVDRATVDRATADRDGPPVADRASRAPAHLEASRLVTTRTGLLLLLAVVFTVNWGETLFETWLTSEYGLGSALTLQNTYAVRWLEGNFSFEGHDLTNPIAVYGYSTSYFFLFPALILGLGLALASRKSITPFRVFSLSLVIDYAVSLPFFLFFPVPERWAYPDSGAMLLSDKWTSSLIETIRPISGLDNCFPSFHTSLTVIIVMLCFVYRTRLRISVLALGATVILSTLVLGIHWLADVIAGIAVGVLSVYMALALERRIRSAHMTRAAT